MSRPILFKLKIKDVLINSRLSAPYVCVFVLFFDDEKRAHVYVFRNFPSFLVPVLAQYDFLREIVTGFPDF